MSYNLLESFKVVSAGSLGANYTSPAIETAQQDNIGLQMNWTGTPTGVFSIQISMDYAQDYMGNVTNAGNWATIVNSITAVGSADVAYVDLNQMSAPYVRVVYTRTSGTGAVDIYVTSKGI